MDGLIELSDSDIAKIAIGAQQERNSPLSLKGNIELGELEDDPETLFLRLFDLLKRFTVYYYTTSRIYVLLVNKRTFLTYDNHIRLGNTRIRCEDKCFCSIGSNVPIIVRPVHNLEQDSRQNKYILVSSCYFQGYMKGSKRDFDFPEEELLTI